MDLGAPKYGRTIKITLENPGFAPLVICDWYEGQDASEVGSLWCSFNIERHSDPQPQNASCEVRGLSRETAATILRLHREAELQAFKDRRPLRSGKLTIYTGYGDDAGVVFTGDLTPKGVQVRYQAPGHVVSLRAQDGRIEWESRFVRKSVGPGVDLRTIRGVLAAAGDYASGVDAERAFEKEFPELVKRREGPAAKEGGFVMFGPSQKVNRLLCRDMGIRPFYVDGQVRYIPADEALLDVAILLREGESLIDKEALELGYYKVRSLVDHRFRAGVQIHLRDRDDKPIGAGTFRVERATLTSSNHEAPSYADLTLRPTVKVEQQL